MSRLDFSNPAAVADWLGKLCASLGDANGITRDLLLPEREREFGHVLHQEHYDAAWKQVEQAMAYAGAPIDKPPEGGPPASRPRPRAPKPEGDGGPEGAA